MKTLFSISILAALVIFTAISPGHKLASKTKIPLTLTELDLSSFESENNPEASTQNVLKVFLAGDFSASPDLYTLIPVFHQNKFHKQNPSLNFLYLAHAPPLKC